MEISPVTEHVQKQLNLPPADQIGFVVPNLEESIARYEPLFGPFKVMEAGVDSANYRGETRDAQLKIAFGKSGDLEIELIEWTGGDSPHKEFVSAGREGMHHIRFPVEDCDTSVRDAEAIGFKVIWYKEVMEGVKFAYMERDSDPLIIEFIQMPKDFLG